MSKLTIMDNEFITMEYWPDGGLIYHTIHKPIQGQLLRDAMNAGTDALAKYRVCKWLSDDRRNGPLTLEDAEWGFNDWNPRTIRKGWKYWANVVPEEVSAAGTLVPMMGDVFRLGLRLMVFTDIESALDWLDEQEC